MNGKWDNSKFNWIICWHFMSRY